jgi:charged multivesicular body protein 7
VQKSTNPDGYIANVSAWEAALTRAALAGRLPSQNRLSLETADELLDELASPQYGRPSGLGCVFDEAVRSGKMIDVKDFAAAEQSIYHRSWVPSPWAVLRWSLRQIGIGANSYDIHGRLRNGNLVLVQALEQISTQVVAKQQKRGQTLTDRVMGRETFAQHFAVSSGSALSDSDIGVLLQYLSRDKQVLSYDDRTIKFKASTATRPELITEQDTNIASLKALIASLETQTASLETRVANLQSAAQSAVKLGNKVSALSALRSKKLAEKTLQQRSDTLHQLEEVYTKIESAADQVDIVNAIETSAGVLKTLNQEVGGVERVDQVMDSLREEMEQVDEVQNATTEPLTNGAVVNETEIDDELEAMEAEQKKEKAEREAREHKEQEEEEAEETKRRLEAIGRAETPIDQRLENDTAKLSQIDIEGAPENSVSRSVEPDMA